MLNWQILPTLKFSPKELLLGLIVNTASTPLATSSSVLTLTDIDNHFTYTVQQCLDGYAEAIHHAIRRKATFDNRVLKSKANVVTCTRGQLVQVHCSDLMNTFSTDQKLQPMWTGPYRIQECLLNSYRLEELDGTPKSSEFSARRLQAFTPREGTELAKAQREIEERLAREDEVGREENRGMMNSLPEVGDKHERQEEEVPEDEELEEEDSNIASRVAGRRGHRQKEGGGWIR